MTERRSGLSSGKRVAAPKKEYGVLAGALLILAAPFLWVIGMVVRYLIPTPQSWQGIVTGVTNVLIWGGGIITVLVVGLLVWARFSKSEILDWSSTKLPEGYRLQPGAVDPAVLWQPDPPPIDEYRKAYNLVTWQQDGRTCHCLETIDSVGLQAWWFLVELDGWLPDLTVSEEVAEFGDSRGDVRVEDALFNEIYRVDAWEESPRAERYRHAMINPRMMDWMMSRVLSWKIRGRFLLHRTTGPVSKPTRILSLMADRTKSLQRIADMIPAFAYTEYADLRGGNQPKEDR